MTLAVKTVLRSLRRHLLPSAMVIATIAVCGASVTIAYVLTEPAFRGLPYRDSSELFAVAERSTDGKLTASLSLDSLSIVETLPVTAHAEARPISGVTTSIDGSTVELKGVEVSESFLPMLGVSTLVGRLADAQGLPGTAPSVVVTFDFWTRALDGRRDVVGHSFSTSAGHCTVAAVLPASFVFPWAGQAQPDVLFVTPAVTGVAAAFVRADPEGLPASQSLGNLALLPLNDYLLGGFAEAGEAILLGFAMLAIALGTTLYLLFLVVQGPRQATQELLVTLGRPARSATIERVIEISVFLLLGLLPAYWLASIGSARLIENIPQREILRSAIVFGPRAVVSGFGITMAVVVVAYAAAALSAGRHRRLNELVAQPAGSRTLGFVATAQVALAVMLLTVAIALGRSVWPLVARDLGFNPADLYITDPTASSGITSPRERHDYMMGVMHRLAQHPGVVAVAGIDSFPPSGALPDRAILSEPGLAREARGAVWRVTPNYFSVLEMTMLSGRTFSDAEMSARESVCVLSSSAAARVLGPDIPIGSEIALGSIRCRAVGVVQDATDSLRGSQWWGVYLPMAPETFRRVTLVTRSSAPIQSLASAAASAFHTTERRIPSRTVSVRSLLTAGVGELGLLTACLEVATLIVICLSVGGTYGIATAQLAARRRVHAVQVALGAGYRQVTASLIRSVSWPIARGALIGGAAGAQYQAYVGSLLSDVTPLPARYLVLACLGLIVLAIAGAAWTARSSMRINLRSVLDETAGIGR